jgi:hypothetical protein
LAVKGVAACAGAAAAPSSSIVPPRPGGGVDAGRISSVPRPVTGRATSREMRSRVARLCGGANGASAKASSAMDW